MQLSHILTSNSRTSRNQFRNLLEHFFCRRKTITENHKKVKIALNSEQSWLRVLWYIRKAHPNMKCVKCKLYNGRLGNLISFHIAWIYRCRWIIKLNEYQIGNFVLFALGILFWVLSTFALKFPFLSSFSFIVSIRSSFISNKKQKEKKQRTHTQTQFF